MTKKQKRRIPAVWGTPELKVRDLVGGGVELVLNGEKLSVTVGLEEHDMRALAQGLRKCFKEIRDSRDRANQYNFQSLKEDAE